MHSLSVGTQLCKSVPVGRRYISLGWLFCVMFVVCCGIGKRPSHSTKARPRLSYMSHENQRLLNFNCQSNCTNETDPAKGGIMKLLMIHNAHTSHLGNRNMCLY